MIVVQFKDAAPYKDSIGTGLFRHGNILGIVDPYSAVYGPTDPLLPQIGNTVI